MGHAQEVAPLNRQAYLRLGGTGSRTSMSTSLGRCSRMVGVRRSHALAAGAIYAKLAGEHVKGSRCNAFMSDMKLFVADADAYFYPDVMVTCDERDRRAELRHRASPAGRRGALPTPPPPRSRAKFAAYRKLADLRSPHRRHRPARLELYRRAADHWLMFDSAATARRCSCRA